ncbi:hypothetical protein HAX54_011854 [Datura stramonium]|uniref:Uncharacterized protein n=1 Tax=Datura stramonium TaxID=4076 RepID=A0ABS8RXF2_DATST|nr:hypothetical protein [Datura stramonium]
MGRKRRAESRWWGHRPLDFSNLPVLTDDCVDEHESIASVMLGPNFSLFGDESESVCADSANPSRGESNLCHENIAPDIRVLPDKGVDDNSKLKGEATMGEHCLVDENTKLKGEATMAEHYSVDENTKLKGKEKMAEHCSIDENVSKKRKFTVGTSNPPCESIPQTTSKTVRQNPDELVGDESNMKTKVLDMSYFHLVETGDFNGYPWGIDVFHAIFESCFNKFKTKPEFYRYSGFPLALQIRLYECCPELKGRFTEHSGSEVSNIFPSANERVLLELDGLTFESPYMGSQSQQFSDRFFCTQAPKVDIGKSSFVYGASTNADLKKELNDFRLHVDVKFGEILEALGHLTKKLEEKKSNERCYSGGGDTTFPDLGMDADKMCIKLLQTTPLMFVKLVWVVRRLT